jgi:MFS superfamily sulfate permease-like transporter
MNAILSPTAMPVLARWIPTFNWLRNYKVDWLRGDVVTGMGQGLLRGVMIGAITSLVLLIRRASPFWGAIRKTSRFPAC